MARLMQYIQKHWNVSILLFFFAASTRLLVVAEIGLQQDPRPDIIGVVTGDPVIRPFGRGPEFLFNGVKDKFYNLFSDPSDLYSVTFQTKLGTYIQAVAAQYGPSMVVVVGVTNDSELKVHINGDELTSKLRSNYTATRLIKQEVGDMSVSYARYAPEVGQLATIVTDEFELEITCVPAGTLDAGGVPQPSYMNLQSCRIKRDPPNGYLQGVLGETYPSTAGPRPLLVHSPDGKVVPVNRTHPILPDEAYERKGFPFPKLKRGWDAVVVIVNVQGVAALAMNNVEVKLSYQLK